MPKALVVSSNLDNLPRVIAFVRQACETAGLDEDAAFACELATDEACTNIMEHAYRGRSNGEIEVICLAKADRFIVQLHDNGKPFDPDTVAPPTLTGELIERQIGGLGLHFMHSLMDEVRFNFDEEEGNTLTMVKYLSR